MKLVTLFIALGLPVSIWGAAPNGEQVYKNNCNRCHITIRTYSNKMSRSIVRHMRIKAGLTSGEASAVLAYLSEGSGTDSKAKGSRE
jgi:hypothetical protein